MPRQYDAGLSPAWAGGGGLSWGRPRVMPRWRGAGSAGDFAQQRLRAMAENESTGVAEATDEQKADDFQYTVKVEDAGPATKKISVEIPRDRIDAKMKE